MHLSEYIETFLKFVGESEVFVCLGLVVKFC